MNDPMGKGTELDKDSVGPNAGVTGSPQPTGAPPRRSRRALGWAAGLALIGAGIGALVGWTSKEPLYRAQGMIYIAPSMPTPGDPDGRNVMPRFQSFLAYQVALLKSARATRLAMGTEAWKRTGEDTGPEAISRFEERRRVLHAPETSHIQVQFLDPNPKTAVAGVHALIEAYQRLSADLNDANDSLEFCRGQVEILESQLKSATDEILSFTTAYGGVEGMEIRHRAAVMQVLETEELLGNLRSRIRAHEGAAERKDDSVVATPPALIALENRWMADALLQLDLLVAEEAYLMEKLAGKNEALVHLRRRIAVHKKRIQKFAEDWNRARGPKQAEGATSQELKEQEESLIVFLSALQAKNRKIGQTRVDVERLAATNKDRIRKISQLNKLVAQLESQLLGKGRITIADPGWLPTAPAEDHRLRSATRWAGVGALPGLLALLVAGMRRRRSRRVHTA